MKQEIIRIDPRNNNESKHNIMPGVSTVMWTPSRSISSLLLLVWNSYKEAEIESRREGEENLLWRRMC